MRIHLRTVLFVLAVISLLSRAAHAQEVECSFADCRPDFQTGFYSGLAIDTFAAGDHKRYLNPQDANGIRERGIAGITFSYRVIGDAHQTYKGQLWVYGETVHGTRSTDLDCRANPNLPPCRSRFVESLNGYKRDFGAVTQPAENAIYMVRNATSMEGQVGLRYEFTTLNASGAFAARPYVKLQAGFLTVQDADSAKAVHEVGGGLTVVKGMWQNSYMDLGFGRTDLFGDRSRRRWKVDALATAPLWKDGFVSPFAEIMVDTDAGYGSDSIQTYIGLAFDLGKILNRKW